MYREPPVGYMRYRPTNINKNIIQNARLTLWGVAKDWGSRIVLSSERCSKPFMTVYV